MRIPLLASVACVAAIFLGGSPAAAEPVAATFTDECRFVRIAYPAGVTGSFEVKRDGADVTAIPLPLPDGGNFAVVARAGQTISLTGSVSGSHTHVTPAGCDEPDVSLVSFEDRCQNYSAVTFRNSGPAAVPGYGIIGRGIATELPALPPGDSRHVAPYAFYIDWTSPDGVTGAFASHHYLTPAGCGPSTLQHSFTDRCDKLEWTLTNGAAGAQLVHLVRGTELLSAQWVPAGGPHTYSVPAVDGAPFQARYSGGELMGEPHTYHAPANCAAGGLPVTGSGTQTLVLFGVLLVVAGFGSVLLARTKRRAGSIA